MKQILTYGFLTLFLTAASGLWAQTTTESNEELQEEFQTAEDLADDGPGTAYVREEHGDWQMRCLRAPEGQADVCRLYQLLRDGESPVAEFSMQSLPSGGKALAGVEFTTPLETLLTANVVMRIDGGSAKQYPYSWCDQFACYSRFGLTEEEIAAMKKGAVGNMRIVPRHNRENPLNLSLSLSGFTAAYNALRTYDDDLRAAIATAAETAQQDGEGDAEAETATQGDN